MPKKVLLLDLDLTLLGIHTRGRGFYYDPEMKKFRVCDPDKNFPVVEIFNRNRWFQILEKAHQAGFIIGIVTNHGGVLSKENPLSTELIHRTLPVPLTPTGSKLSLTFSGNRDEGDVRSGGVPAIFDLLEHYWPQRSFLKDKKDIVAFILDKSRDNFKKLNTEFCEDAQELNDKWNALIRKVGKKPHIDEFLKRHGLTDLSPENVFVVDDTVENIFNARFFDHKGFVFDLTEATVFDRLEQELDSLDFQATSHAVMAATSITEYICIDAFDKEAAITTPVQAPMNLPKTKYVDQVTINFQNPAPDLEDQNKFPRSGGSAYGQTAKATSKGLSVHTLDMAGDPTTAISSQSQEVLKRISNKTRIYINGHGAIKGDHITGQDCKGKLIRWDYKQLAAFIAKHCPQLTSQPGVTISLVMCYGGVGGLESFANKLADELWQVHHIETNIYGRMGAVSRHQGGVYKKTVEGKHHQDGSKLLVSTVGSKKVITPYLYSTPIANKDSFHPYLTRQAVEEVFLQAKSVGVLEPGEFIFRSGSLAGTMVCSYVDDDLSFKHLQIKNMKADGSFDLADENKTIHCKDIEFFTYQYGRKLKKAVPHALSSATNLIEAKEKLFAQLQKVTVSNLTKMAELRKQFFRQFIQDSIVNKNLFYLENVSLDELEKICSTFMTQPTDYLITSRSEEDIIISFKGHTHLLHYQIRPSQQVGKVLIAPLGSDEFVEYDSINTFGMLIQKDLIKQEGYLPLFNKCGQAACGLKRGLQDEIVVPKALKSSQ